MHPHSSSLLPFTGGGARRIFVFGLLLAALLGCFYPASAQTTTTQQVQLTEGWNMVSLRVHPEDSSFDAIFEGHMDQIAMVRGETGRVYVPGENIEQITSWAVDEGYLVYAEGAVTVEVTGTPVAPGPTTVPLGKGGNVVPYFSAEPLAAEQALMALGETLVVAEDEEGQRYRPSAPSSSLDSLRPGQGYTLYLDRPDTLSYPVVVNTLAEALALQDVDVGRHVQVRGYHTPGDGGGGMFEVTDSGCETDGGTCFVFDEDLSAEQSVTTNDSDPNLPDTDLVWGTFSAKIGPEDGERIEDIDMHGGHGWQQEPSDPAWIQFKKGNITSNQGGSLFLVRRSMGGGDNYDITYHYKTATTNRRLERQGVTNSVSLAWWGAPKADPNNPVEAWGEIGWATKAAADLYKSKNIDWAYVDIPGEYYYHHSIRQRDGTKLRGVGPERSVPGESWTTRGKLTITPGEALHHMAQGFSAGAENDVRTQLASKQHISNHYLAQKWGYEDIELDGNYPNNKRIFDQNDDKWDTAAMEGWLQNSGDWAGWHTNGAGPADFDPNAEMHWERVHVHDHGGNGVATRPRGPEVYADQVSVGDMIRNHSVYHFNNTDQIKNVSTYGSMWSPAFKIGSKDDDPTTYTNLRYHTAKPNPEGFRQQGLVNVIGDNMTIDGFEADLRGQNSGITTGFTADKSTSNTYKNGTIYTNAGGLRLVAHREGATNDLFENFTIYSNGSGVELIANRNDEGLTFRNITVEAGQNAEGDASEKIFLRYQDAKHSDLSKPGRVDVVNYNYNRGTTGPTFKGSGSPENVRNSLPRDLFIRNSSFPAGAPFFDDDGRWSAFGDTDDNFQDQRIYLVNTMIDLPASWIYPFGNNKDRGPDRHGIGSAEGRPTATFMLRDVQDHSGRVSDQTGTYTSDTSDVGNDYVLIPTNLIYRAWGRSAAVTSGSRTVQSVEVANSDGSLRSMARGVNQREPYLKVNLDAPIQAGNTIEIDWEAHATPLDEFSTTGAFIGRPVYDKSFASGNGPFTVDLRGVLESQESKDAPIYTASSGDTSVVTANVQGDGYTLELTGQGTGTATITVTGEIESVGTATTTFEVTVE